MYEIPQQNPFEHWIYAWKMKNRNVKQILFWDGYQGWMNKEVKEGEYGQYTLHTCMKKRTMKKITRERTKCK
jgi:hypothetical protein